MNDDRLQEPLFDSQDLSKARDYWTGKLSADITAGGFPYDCIKTDTFEYETGIFEFELPAETGRQLVKLSNGSDERLNMILTAGICALLYRYTSNQEITVINPVYKQNVEGTFINTILLLKSCLKPEYSFKELLLDIRRDINESEENQNFPLLKLMSKLKIPFSGNSFPLYETATLLENIHDRRYIKDINTNIIFAFTRDGSYIKCRVEYNRLLYKPAAVEMFASHLMNLYRQVSGDVNIRLGEIDILSADEKHKLLTAFNDTHVAYPCNMTLCKMFEDQVSKTPDNIALVFGNKQWTYRQLDQEANGVAEALHSRGISRGSIVGLMVERSLEMAAGILGILKAGGAYLPIDPEYPEDRTGYMLRDSGADALLTAKHLSGKVEFGGRIIYQEDCRPSDDSGLDFHTSAACSDLAYIIYTSGTTGKPKGVMVEHGSIANTIQWRKDEYRLDSSDTVLQLFSFCFDGFLTSFFTPIVSGSRVILLDDVGGKNPEAIKNYISQYQVTHFISVPVLFSAVLDCMAPDDAKSLRIVTLAGDSVPPRLIAESMKKNPAMELVNEYGPTECSVASTIFRNMQCSTEILIGKPIANMFVYMLDDCGRLQPVGIPGELCIGGNGLAKGYLNRAELTAEKFVADPFKEEGRIYKTGDLARWTQDGNIEFLGRKDNQVKVRGFRVEIAEVEARLLDYEPVKKAVVIDRKDEYGNLYLCGYVVSDRRLAASELREHMSGELPHYMIPSCFVQLEDIPLTTNGKIDRRALPEPDDNMRMMQGYQAPEDETEAKLAEIWAAVLKVGQVGTGDNFFDLGGHSMKATALMSLIHKHLNVEVPLKEIFDRPTVKELALYIKNAIKNPYIMITPSEKRDYYPLSSAQMRLFVIEHLGGAGTAYNIPGTMLVEGKLEKDRLEAAARALIQRHETLRTSFELVGGEPVQRVHDQVSFTITYAEADESSLEQTVKEFVRPFNLNKAPLLRIGLVRIDENRQVLMYDMHHIISDGVSMGILVKEFIDLYGGKVLPKLQLQYRDFTIWQNDFLKSDAVKKQEEYWLSVFDHGVPVLDLPLDYPRKTEQSFAGDSVSFELPQQLAERLKALIADTGATLFMVLLAAYNVLMSAYSGQEDIVIGSYTAGRNRADLENIIGMFVNTIVFRNFPRWDMSFSSFLESVVENSMKVYENQDYQFEELVNRLKLPKVLGRNPLFDVSLILHNNDTTEIKIPGLNFAPCSLGDPVAKFDLLLQAAEAGNILRLDFIFRTDLFSRSTIEKMSRDYVRILETVVQDRDIELRKIALESTSAFRKKILLDEVDFSF